MGVLFVAHRQATPHNCTTCLHEERCNGSKTNVWCPNWRARETNNNPAEILRNCARLDVLTDLERGELEAVAADMEEMNG